MTLYQIDAALEALIDPETGELRDYDAYESLAIERDVKLENTALYIKNLEADAEAIKAEEKALADRRRAAENRAAGLRMHLAEALNGERFETPRVAISFRKSEPLEVADPVKFVEWATDKHPEYLKWAQPTINKDAVKTALKDGAKIPGAEIVTRQNLQIK
jgi:hypothetical protein